jgi:hypothetical protein
MTLRTRFLALATALVAVPALALDAQIIRVPSASSARRPVSASVQAGYFQTQSRYDRTGEFWALGDGFQYRAAVDVGIRSGSIGLTGTLATIPLVRSSNPSGRGDIQFRQLMATFRSPEGSGFHQLFEVSAGLAQWANYSGSDVLSPSEREARNAFSLVIGYGFGFPVTDRAAFTLVQDAATIIGSSEGLPSGARRSVQQYTTRLGLRYRFTGAR